MEGLKKIDFMELINIVVESEEKGLEDLDLFFAPDEISFFLIDEIYLYPNGAIVRNSVFDRSLEINKKSANIFKKSIDKKIN